MSLRRNVPNASFLQKEVKLCEVFSVKMVLHFRLDRNHFVIFRNVTLAGSQTGGNLIDEKCFISLLHA